MLQPLKIWRQNGVGGVFTALMNPAEMKTASAQRYSKVQPAGTKGEGQRPDTPDDESISFSLVLDGTGVVPLRQRVAPDVPGQLKALEDVVGLTSALSGAPAWIAMLKISWGDFCCQGRLKSLRTTYTLFAADGTPLRAKVELAFIAQMVVLPAPRNAAAADGAARQVRTEPGLSLAEICDQMYGDAVSCEQVASFNQLPSLRDLPPDTELLLPGLSSTRTETTPALEH